jgi:glycosyltransferase involved in cell wall biosynthesis
MQNYSNFHTVVLDDQSTDGTGDKLRDYLQRNQVSSEKYLIVKNKEKLYAMGSLRKAAREYCRSDDIFMVVDGDDELLGRQTLKVFNAAFQREGAWFVYSNFLGSNGEIGYSRPLPADIR